MAESSTPAKKDSVYDFRNARFTQHKNSNVKNSLVLSIKSETTQEQKDSINATKPPPDIHVTAKLFANKVKALNEVSAHGSSAKDKLMQIRYKQPEATNAPLDHFSGLLENKSIILELINPLGMKVHLIDISKINIPLGDIKVTESKHEITDQQYSLPPTSKKVADLQQLLGIKINGLFDRDTFNSFVEAYFKALLKSDAKPLIMFEKLMLTIVQRIGTEIKTGAFLKGLLVVKAAIASAQLGKTGEFDKLFFLMDKYLPDKVRFKLKERVRVVQRLFKVINSSEIVKSEALSSLINEEKYNLATEDKIRILDAYNNLAPTIYSGESDKSNQIFLIKSLSVEVLTEEQKQKINKNIDSLIKFFREAGIEDKLIEIENLYNRIKMQALRQIIR